MSAVIAGALQKGVTFRDAVAKLNGLQAEGKKLTVVLEERCVPYLADRVEGWVDGPPTSVVAFVLSGADPGGDKWRRWTLSKVGPWKYELGCFPTPFKNGLDPLAPGVPPTSSRRR